MTIRTIAPFAKTTFHTSANFRSWQRDTLDRGLLPVIGITGGRGKSTVVRMLDSILAQAHLRTATWTDLGIDIRGKRQRGEISGWSLALSRLSEGSIDIAIQELHWSTINAVGLPESSYPVIGITNAPGEREPYRTSESDPVVRAAIRAVSAVHRDGWMVVNGDAFSLIGTLTARADNSVLTAISPDAPGLRKHLQQGGSGAWVHDRNIVLGDDENIEPVLPVASIPSSLSGAALFEVSSALIAASIGATIGIDLPTISAGLQRFQSDDNVLPGSFNVYNINGYRAVVDLTSPSWHLKSLLRAINPGTRRRQITVIGDLSQLPAGDVYEVGRLLGRSAGAIILHSNSRDDLIQHFRKGIAANDFPPLAVYLATERRALNRALKTVRADDVALVLTGEDPGPANRALQRAHARALDHANRDEDS